MLRLYPHSHVRARAVQARRGDGAWAFEPGRFLRHPQSSAWLARWASPVALPLSVAAKATTTLVAMTEESNPPSIRAVPDSWPEPIERTRDLRLELEQKTAQIEEVRTRLEAVERRLDQERQSSREARDALTALRDERNLLAVHLHAETLALEALEAERSETSVKIKGLEQELRLAWHKVEALEQLLAWERRPLYRRALGRRPSED
jgi:septal ring factor EnvC (AmiA/AmiB activator)